MVPACYDYLVSGDPNLTTSPRESRQINISVETKYFTEKYFWEKFYIKISQKFEALQVNGNVNHKK